MKRIIYLLFCLLAASQLSAQNCYFSATSNALGVYNFTSFTSLPTAPYTYLYSFGDGSSSTAQNPIHTYNPGVYTVCLLVTDANGTTCNYCDSLVVPTPSNNCYFSFFVDSLNPNMVRLFGVPAYSNTYLSWSFGDGSNGIGPYPTHSYFVNGVYQICMTEIDTMTQAIMCQSCQAITIGGLPTTCSIIATPNSATNNYNFQASVSTGGGYTINWNFGDNSVGSGSNINHQYASAGVYNVCMDVLDSSNNLICSDCQSVTVGSNPANCTFTYTVNPSGVVVLSAPQIPGAIFTWYSSASTFPVIGNPATIVYLPGISYDSVCVVATDSLGNVLCNYCGIVQIGNNTPGCVANFASASLGLDAYFIDLSQTYTSSSTFSWSFGDGTSSNLRFPQHTYTSPGFRTVCLTIQDGNCQDTYCSTIYIDSVITVPTLCSARFVFTQTAPYQLTVVNLSSGLNLSYLWDFGDGSTSNMIYPTHTYTSTGSYNLCLTVSDSTGCSSTYCDTIGVDSAGNIIYRATAGFDINVVSPNQITASIDQITKDISAAIYPNPATSTIRVQSKELKGSLTYRVLNIQGSEAARGVLNSSDESIRLDNLTPGMYMLEMTDASQNKVFGRFIKN